LLAEIKKVEHTLTVWNSFWCVYYVYDMEETTLFYVNHFPHHLCSLKKQGETVQCTICFLWMGPIRFRPISTLSAVNLDIYLIMSEMKLKNSSILLLGSLPYKDSWLFVDSFFCLLKCTVILALIGLLHDILNTLFVQAFG
jgi:hypothetical protein